MPKERVTDRELLEQQEMLFLCLMKAEAMAQLMMNHDLLDVKPSTMYAYLLSLCDVIKNASLKNA